MGGIEEMEMVGWNKSTTFTQTPDVFTLFGRGVMRPEVAMRNMENIEDWLQSPDE